MTELAAQKKLIDAARSGDTSAWEMLVRAHQTPVFRLAYLILGDPAEADDVAQEVFVRAFLNLDRFDTGRPLRPWLLTLTRHQAFNWQRRLSRAWRRDRHYVRLEAAAAGASTAPTTLEQQEQARALGQAVRRLRPKHQEVIYLRYFLAQNEFDMAQTLGVPPGTVKSRLHRALRQLERVIRRDFPALADTMSYE